MTQKEQALHLLNKIEEFRIKLEKGEIKEGSADWTVRMCQAIIAEEHFESRKEWTKSIK